MAGKARTGIALHWTEFLSCFSLHFQAVRISFLSVSVCQLTFGSPYASEAQIFKSSCSLFWYLFAHQSDNPVHNLASAEKEQSPKHLGFLGPSGVFRYLQRPVLLLRPLGPAPTAWGVWEDLIQQLWPQAGYLPAELQHWERGLYLLSSCDLQQFGITLSVY